jgi:hypothetical protein
MGERIARVLLTCDPASLEAGMERGAAVTDASARAMGDSVDGLTTRAGGSFSKLGSKLEALGVPGASAFDKIGSKISEADTHGQKFMQTVSTLGGVSLVAGAAGFVAIGAASVEMANKFDVAQTEVQNAVKNTGQNFDKVKPSIDDTYSSLSNLGFTSTESASALSGLIIATGKTGEAEKVLSIAADLARAKHISLESATAIMTKTLAGSTRALTSLGLNLDIGSGKLKTIATDTTAFQNAQDKLKQVQDAVNVGALTGIKAYAGLTTAHDAVDTASKKLALDQGTISTILDTVKQKTEGAASAYGQTLAGQMDIAKAKADDLGVKFGNFLIPKLIDAEHAVQDIVGWFEKHKTAAEALAISIGTVLAGAVAVFTVNTAVGMVGAVKSALTSIGILSAAEDTTAATTDALTAQVEALNATLAANVGADASAAAGLEGVGAAATTSAGEMDAATAASGEAGMAGGMAAGEGAAVGLSGALLPLAAAAGGVVIGAMALSKALQGALPKFADMANAAASITTTTLPQMTLKMADLQHAQDAAAKSMHEGGLVGQAAQTAYKALQGQMETLRGEETNLTNNVSLLSTNFGISKVQAQQVAQAIGVNLGGALTKADVKAFSQQIQTSGLNMDTAGSKAANMGTKTVAALSGIGANLHTLVSSADWAGLGASIDHGIANGITASQGVVVNAASGMVQSVITASRTGLKAASPSKVFYELGTWVGQGFAQGIDQTSGLATSAVNSMVRGAIPNVSGVNSSGFSSGGSSVPGSSGAGATTGLEQIILQIDGHSFATLVLPHLQTVGSLQQRTVPLGLFGSPNLTVS